METQPYVVTISHQVGSGGAYLGEKLSKRLGIPFLDREILKEVARQLYLAESQVEEREERLSNFWLDFGRFALFTAPNLVFNDRDLVISDGTMFKEECATIRHIAEKNAAIILGRCGWYVLRDNPRCVRLLVMADQPARVRRLIELYKLSEADAVKMIEKNDQERSRYIRTFTGQNWLDARHYDLCVTTSAIGLDQAVDLVETCIRMKLKL